MDRNSKRWNGAWDHASPAASLDVCRHAEEGGSGSLLGTGSALVRYPDEAVFLPRVNCPA